MNCVQSNEDHFYEMRKNLVKHFSKYTKNADIQGIEIGSLIRILANYYSAAFAQKTIFGELSGPRMGILLRLLAAEENGDQNGVNPTELSHYQHVKKNTISSLLRGLEENGLIERALDPQDKRAFKIRITDTGKELIKSVGPQRLKMMNELAAELTLEERSQLVNLLEKLRASIRKNAEFLINQDQSLTDMDHPE